MDERRRGYDDLIFKVGEIHQQCKRIPVIEAKIEDQDDKINSCRNKSKLVHTSSSFAGGMFGGFMAVLAKKFLIG